MINLNLHNVEQLIFYDKNLQTLIPEFRPLFDQWRLSQLSPGLRSLGKRSIMDFLNSLKNEHIAIMENYFKSSITLTKMEYNVVKNLEFKVSDNFEKELNDTLGFTNIATYRNKDSVYISMWR